METESLVLDKRTLVAKPFDIRHTVESGQPLAFHADFSDNGLSYVTNKGLFSIRYANDRITYNYFGDYSESEARKEVAKRFGLNDNMKKVYAAINTDKFMQDAIRNFNGMRITENGPWESTLCFIISQFNNMKRIRLITKNLIAKFGDDYKNVKLFPSAESISTASVDELRECGTGFRAKYIRSTADMCANNIDMRKLYKMDYDDAKEALMELDGIGDKVADCILLFGYKKLDAFPIDLWVKRVMEEVYFKGRKRNIRELHEFAESRWEKRYLGYAQQYIFYNGRSNKVGVK